MPVVINGITCGELVKDYTESVSGGKITATKSYICLWPQRFQVANGLLGFTTGTRAGGTIFHPPTRHPDMPGITCRSVSIRPVGAPYDGPNQSAWTSAIISAEFGSLEWPALASDDPPRDQSIDPSTSFLYCSQKLDFGVEHVTFPGSAMVWYQPGNNGKIPFNYNRSLPIRHVEMSLTFHKLPYMPIAFLPLVDCVNSVKFLGCDPGFVKFNGGSTEREYQSDGSITQSVNVNFSYRPKYRWNSMPDPTGASGKVWVNYSYKNGDPVFANADLYNVFPPNYMY